MKRGIEITAAAAFPGGPLRAPSRFRIWGPGNNPGDYGDNVFDDAAAAAVMAEYERRGNMLAIDVEHATNPIANPSYDPAKPPPMAGYCGLAVVGTPAGPELWADPVRWSEYGRAQIESGERCYISPDWLRGRDLRPVKLHKLSLVAEPGTFGIPLLASRRVAGGAGMDAEKIAMLIKLAESLAESAQNAELKRMGAELARQLREIAGSLGIDPGAGAGDGEAAPASAPDAAVAGQDEEQDAAVAGQDEEQDKPTPAAAGKGVMTPEWVRRAVAEAREVDRLIEANKDWMTDGMRALLAGKGLAEVRRWVGALPPRPVEASTGDNKPSGVSLRPLVAGAAPAPKVRTAEEADADRLRVSLGVKRSAVADVERRLAAGKPIGVLDISRFMSDKSPRD